MKKIKLTQGKYAIVDEEDYHYLSRFKWHLAKGSADGNFMARRGLKSVKENGVTAETYISMEQFIIPPKLYAVIGFKNKNTLDCRKENLFYESYSTKRHRADKEAGKCSSKYKGVCWNKDSKKWTACIYKKYIKGEKVKRYGLGYFNNEKEAGLAYNEKAIELYGEYAYQNNIER